jgi:hypothetical protein
LQIDREACVRRVQRTQKMKVKRALTAAQTRSQMNMIRAVAPTMLQQFFNYGATQKLTKMDVTLTSSSKNTMPLMTLKESQND